MTLYGEREGAVGSVLQIAMPRSPRLYAPEGTMHVVARCNNREEKPELLFLSPAPLLCECQEGKKAAVCFCLCFGL
jgi:hypothetical protein